MTAFHMFGFEHGGKTWRAICRPWRLETASDPRTVPVYWWLVAEGLSAIRGPEYQGIEPAGAGKVQLIEECREMIDRAQEGIPGRE
jgi:hypothetical protein